MLLTIQKLPACPAEPLSSHILTGGRAAGTSHRQGHGGGHGLCVCGMVFPSRSQWRHCFFFGRTFCKVRAAGALGRRVRWGTRQFATSWYCTWCHHQECDTDEANLRLLLSGGDPVGCWRPNPECHHRPRSTVGGRQSTQNVNSGSTACTRRGRGTHRIQFSGGGSSYVVATTNRPAPKKGGLRMPIFVEFEIIVELSLICFRYFVYPLCLCRRPL